MYKLYIDKPMPIVWLFGIVVDWNSISSVAFNILRVVTSSGGLNHSVSKYSYLRYGLIVITAITYGWEQGYSTSFNEGPVGEV